MEFKDITPNFYQDANQKPFCECTFCGKNLQDSNEPYLIEKSFKRNRESKQLLTVIEYAICMQCTIKKSQAISEESKQNIEIPLSSTPTKFWAPNLRSCDNPPQQ